MASRLLVLVFFLAVSACGMLDGEYAAPEDGRESRALAQGYTPCNDYPDPKTGVICHPNQYCRSQYFGMCSLGCLSEDNCTRQQSCVKEPGEHIGICVDRAQLEGGSGD